MPMPIPKPPAASPAGDGSPGELGEAAETGAPYFAELFQQALTAHNQEVARLHAEIQVLRLQVPEPKLMPIWTRVGEASAVEQPLSGCPDGAPGSTCQADTNAAGCETQPFASGGGPAEPLAKTQNINASGGVVTVHEPPDGETNDSKARCKEEDPQDECQLDSDEAKASRRIVANRASLAAHRAPRVLFSERQTPPLERFLKGPFDRVCSAMIILNFIVIFASLQHDGSIVGIQAGSESPDLSNESGDAFHVVDTVFTVFFSLELFFRMAVYRLRFFHDEDGIQGCNLLDAFIVVGSAADLIFTQSAAGNLSMLRPFRFLRTVRTLRILRSVEMFQTLRILVHTIFASFVSLVWSIILLVLVMLTASMLLCQSLMLSARDESISLETRAWVYRMYGTPTRSFYTFFELTFSGGWPNYARKLVEEVSPIYSIFFFLYIVVVVFAMFRIISALFLKDTLAVAESHAEWVVEEKMKEKRNYADKLLDYFNAADTSADGFLTEVEFYSTLENESVRAWLNVMDVDVHDAHEFFDMLAGADGLVSAGEFVQGCMRLKGAARSQDLVAVLRGTQKVAKDTYSIQLDISKLQAECTGLSSAFSDLQRLMQNALVQDLRCLHNTCDGLALELSDLKYAIHASAAPKHSETLQSAAPESRL